MNVTHYSSHYFSHGFLSGKYTLFCVNWMKGKVYIFQNIFRVMFCLLLFNLCIPWKNLFVKLNYVINISMSRRITLFQKPVNSNIITSRICFSILFTFIIIYTCSLKYLYRSIMYFIWGINILNYLINYVILLCNTDGLQLR